MRLWGHLAKYGNIFGSHGMGKGFGAAAIHWVEASNTAEDTAAEWTAPHQKLTGPK